LCIASEGNYIEGEHNATQQYVTQQRRLGEFANFIVGPRAFKEI
jgi:hypothetical protein